MLNNIKKISICEKSIKKGGVELKNSSNNHPENLMFPAVMR